MQKYYMIEELGSDVGYWSIDSKGFTAFIFASRFKDYEAARYYIKDAVKKGQCKIVEIFDKSE